MANEREEELARYRIKYEEDHAKPSGAENSREVNQWRVARDQWAENERRKTVRSAAEKRVRKPTAPNKGWTEGVARSIGDKSSQVHYRDNRPRPRR